MLNIEFLQYLKENIIKMENLFSGFELLSDSQKALFFQSFFSPAKKKTPLSTASLSYISPEENGFSQPKKLRQKK